MTERDAARGRLVRLGAGLVIAELLLVALVLWSCHG